ncbi:class I SAM-dependent methyltransferase [Bradyrhizobium canariense]|uniref:class I SAM-dependent methyltransferase n=1 Tax=Bradyrhizobium canariense TaxID=255045 RepID=UPI001CA4B13D|nr:class I SAM-dependent methyltransferase [Bradyrhizobium canariense]MBW5438022.1 class I SAM-dependent methyltransferase [Bradyrhizobium canariense]
MPKSVSRHRQIKALCDIALHKLRRDGLASFLKSGTERLRHLYASKQAPSDFDRQYGTDTGGIVPLWKLQIRSSHQRDGVRYQASDPDFVRRAIEALPIRPKDFQYVDVGSGKGLTLLVASEYPFRRILGIEFSAELHAIATENIRKHPRPKCQDVSSVLADAANYDFSAENTILFLYNPFGKDVLQSMLEKLRASVVQDDREIYVVYSHSVFSQVFDESGFLERMQVPIEAAVYRHLPAHDILHDSPRPHIHVVRKN